MFTLPYSSSSSGLGRHYRGYDQPIPVPFGLSILANGSSPAAATPIIVANRATPASPAGVPGGAGQQALIDKLRADNAKFVASIQQQQKQLVATRDLINKLTAQLKAAQAGGGGAANVAPLNAKIAELNGLVTKLRADNAKIVAGSQTQQKQIQNLLAQINTYKARLGIK